MNREQTRQAHVNSTRRARAMERETVDTAVNGLPEAIRNAYVENGTGTRLMKVLSGCMAYIGQLQEELESAQEALAEAEDELVEAQDALAEAQRERPNADRQLDAIRQLVGPELVDQYSIVADGVICAYLEQKFRAEVSQAIVRTGGPPASDGQESTQAGPSAGEGTTSEAGPSPEESVVGSPSSSLFPSVSY